MNRSLSTFLTLIPLFLLVPRAATAQMRHNGSVDFNQHLYAIVGMQGSGTPADPKRPMFTPAEGLRAVAAQKPGASVLAQRTGIISYHAEISDDGAHALVEFVAVSQSDLKEILSTTDSRVQLFPKGVKSRDAIEAAFKVFKKDFSFDRFVLSGVR